MSDKESDGSASLGHLIFFRCMLACAIGIYAVLAFFMIISLVEHWTGKSVAEGRDLLSIPAMLGFGSEGSRYDSSNP